MDNQNHIWTFANDSDAKWMCNLLLQLQKHRKLDNAYGDDISLTDGQYLRKHILRHLPQQFKRHYIFICIYYVTVELSDRITTTCVPCHK